MFPFFRRKKYISPLREWIREKIKSTNKNEVAVFTESIILSISLFNDSQIKKRKDIRKDYQGDSTLFELGSFILFYMDIWFFFNRKPNKDVVMELITTAFLKVFNENLKIENLDELLENRLFLYSTIVNKTKENYLVNSSQLLEDLIFRTKNNGTPKMYSEEDLPLINFGLIDSAVLRIMISTYLENFLPIVSQKTQSMDEYVTRFNKEMKMN